MTAVALGLAVLAIALHAGLIPAATWGSDEFITFAELRDGGVGYFLKRLLEWSPRPISEGLLWAYSAIVDGTGRQLMIPFLALMWCFLVLATLAGVGRLRSPSAWLMALTVLALLLLSRSVGDVFYWPMGAAAYLPSLAAITFLVLRLIRGSPTDRVGRIACMVALTVAAATSEVGIIFVATLCTALLPFGRPAWRVAPLIVAVTLGGMLLHGRVRQGIELMSGSRIYFHRMWPSLAEAARQFASELWSGDMLTGASGPLLERFDRVAFVAGLAICLRRLGGSTGTTSWLLAIGGALLLTAYVTLASAYYEFGVLCCDRHATMRGSMVVLLLVVVAAALSRWRRLDRLSPRGAILAGSGLLGLAVCLLLVARGPAIVEDFRAMPLRISIRTADWRAGKLSSGGDPLGFRMLRAGRVVDGFDIPTGTFRTTDTPPPPWTVLGIMRYFGRTEAVVTLAP